MYKGRKVISYSESFKLSIVSEVESGHSINLVKLRYGIKGGETIQRWIKRYGKNHLLNKKVIVMNLDEMDELKRLRAENKALKIAYGELSLESKCLNTLVDLADERYGLELKKNYDLMLSQSSKKKSE